MSEIEYIPVDRIQLLIFCFFIGEGKGNEEPLWCKNLICHCGRHAKLIGRKVPVKPKQAEMLRVVHVFVTVDSVQKIANASIAKTSKLIVMMHLRLQMRRSDQKIQNRKTCMH